MWRQQFFVLNISTHTAIANTAKGVISAIQLPTLAPGPSEVLIRVEYAAMISSDAYVTDLGFFVESYPSTLGFNASGTVFQIGSSIRNLDIEDRVGKSCGYVYPFVYTLIGYRVHFQISIRKRTATVSCGPSTPLLQDIPAPLTHCHYHYFYLFSPSIGSRDYGTLSSGHSS